MFFFRLSRLREQRNGIFRFPEINLEKRQMLESSGSVRVIGTDYFLSDL